MKIYRGRCSYTIMLALSFLCLAAAWYSGYMREVDGRIVFYRSDGGDWTPLTGEMAESFLTVRPEKWFPEEEEVGEEPEEFPRMVMYEEDVSWFDDALFIGDSRTVGLHEYGNLGNAEVLADSGMSVYKLFKKEFSWSSGEKGTLEELLSERQFGKIYLMLGINELGYSFHTTVTRYTEMVERIQNLQPDALIFLQANLHISKEKSETSPVYNNESIDRFNEAVKELADDESRFYLDVNEMFDDEEGNLAAEYTADDIHVLAKYYRGWVEWILKHAVKLENADGTEQGAEILTGRTDNGPCLSAVCG